MKAQIKSASTTKDKAMPAAKPSARKAKSKVGRRASSLKRTTNDLPGSPLAGYSKQAQELFDRGKTAFHAASNWAGDTAKHLPGAARKLNLPDQKAAMEYAEQRPLIVGAVGLGVGLVVGALLPRMHSAPTPKRRR
jgi:ElaB/YqjD/DUF883 family membrane-anchored ribosome-binding protein